MEQFVNFVTATLLKEKGFNKDTVLSYNQYGNIVSDFAHRVDVGAFISIDKHDTGIRYPTQQEVIDWIVVEFGIAIQIVWCLELHGWKYLVFDINTLETLHENQAYITWPECANDAITITLEKDLQWR